MWVMMAELGFIYKTGLDGLWLWGRQRGGKAVKRALALGVFREQQEGGGVCVSMAKEADTEHQCRGRRDPMVRSQIKYSRSCPMRNRVPGDSRTEMCHELYLV